MPEPTLSLDFASFCELATPGTIVPLYMEMPFDLDTPVTAFAKLREGPFAFLLESVEGGERWGRFSFVGSAPREAWRLDGDEIRTWSPEGGWGTARRTRDPFADFEAWVRRFRPVPVEGLPRVWGGAVGFFGYDTVRWLERLADPPPDDLGAPDACFLATDRTLVIDNLFSRALAVRATPIPAPEEGVAPGRPALRALYEESEAVLRQWVERLAGPHGLRPAEGPRGTPASPPPSRGTPPAGTTADPRARDLVGNRTQADYEADVARVREYIMAGDAYQVVVSQRVEASPAGDALDVYRALRGGNPSPYLFLIELDGTRLIGSSPETLVRVEGREVTVRPIAGTRPRGATSAEDQARERELVADEKERAEHVMLVDLGRNDVGRVARPGSVRVPLFMTVERYSHVMHLVSEVTGTLRDGVTAIDAFKACFPAGTLTGAPKVRAMEIIDELEPTRRGPYGGAAGYVAYGAESLDMAIIIRTLVAVGDRVYAQAGAGIVYDSEPAREWEETRHKARVLLGALGVPGAALPDEGALPDDGAAPGDAAAPTYAPRKRS